MCQVISEHARSNEKHSYNFLNILEMVNQRIIEFEYYPLQCISIAIPLKDMQDQRISTVKLHPKQTVVNFLTTNSTFISIKKKISQLF